MKTTTTILAALILMVSTAFANGNETKSSKNIKLYETQNQQYRLIYPFADKEKVDIRIKDASGNTLTKDRVYNKEGFLRKYDMTALNEGSYTMEIKTETGNYIKTFEVSNKQQMAANHLGNKRVKLIYSDEVKKGTLKIFNKSMELIHKESYQNVDGFSRVYDLSAFDCNEFTFQIGNESIALAIND